MEESSENPTGQSQISRPYTAIPRQKSQQRGDRLMRIRKCASPGPGDASRSYLPETRIVLVGKTGSGKSCTGNTLLGKFSFWSKHGMESITKKCAYSTCQYHKGTVVVIDTPGSFDTDMSQEELQNEISKCMGLASPGFHVLLLMIPTDIRYTQESQQSTDFYMHWFGEGVTQYIIPVFTKCDLFKNDMTTSRTFLRDAGPELNAFMDKLKHKPVFVNNRAGGDKQKEREKLFNAIERVIDLNKAECFTNKDFQRTEEILRQIERERQSKQKIPQESDENGSDIVKLSSVQCSIALMDDEEEGQATPKRSSTRGKIIDDDPFLKQIRDVLLDIFSRLVKLLRGDKSAS